MSEMHIFVGALDLRKLRYMLALAEFQSFSKAAEMLNISQSALSRSIKSLEDELETQLFERTTRDVVMTAAGKQGIDAAQLVLSSAADFYRLVRSAGQVSPLEFRIGVSNVMASVFGPILLHSFTREFPDLTLTLKVDTPESLYDLLLAEDIDTVIGTTETMPNSPHFIAEKVQNFPRRFFARANHPLSGASNLEIRDLMKYPCGISYPLPEKVIDEIKRVFEIASLNTLFHLRSNHHGTLLDLMLKGEAIIFGANIAYLDRINAGQIVELDVVPRFPKDMPMIVSRLTGRSVPAVSESLAERLRSWIAAV